VLPHDLLHGGKAYHVNENPVGLTDDDRAVHAGFRCRAQIDDGGSFYALLLFQLRASDEEPLPP
jgi:hypothetical protein